MKLYHYTSRKFEAFDASKCDGIWFTDIAPSDYELLEEIGAAGMSFVAVCEVSFCDEMRNGDNHDVEKQLTDNKADCIVNSYDGFTDYAIANVSQVSILEWIAL